MPLKQSQMDLSSLEVRKDQEPLFLLPHSGWTVVVREDHVHGATWCVVALEEEKESWSNGHFWYPGFLLQPTVDFEASLLYSLSSSVTMRRYRPLLLMRSLVVGISWIWVPSNPEPSQSKQSTKNAEPAEPLTFCLTKFSSDSTIRGVVEEHLLSSFEQPWSGEFTSTMFLRI